MKFKLLFLALAVGVFTKMTAQVEDVSFFVTPTASYNWFDDKTTVEDGLMYGLQAGFGFGKGVEIRGLFEQTSDLNQDFNKYTKDANDLGLNLGLNNRDVRVRRIGGEFKFNIPSGSVAPYVVVGTGVQSFKRKFEDLTLKSENLYGSAGLGLKFNITERLTFNVEGRLFGYNMRPNKMLADPDMSADNPVDAFDEWLEGQEKKTMFNYAVNAGLQLYLGGTNDKKLSALDQAYRKRFSSGLADFKVTLAPMGAYVDFDSGSAFRDAYLLGGELGVDFTDFVGLRAYYLKATEDEKVSFDFDKLAMYGADFVGRLNIARGIVPYITVGGGYIDVSDSYIGQGYVTELSSKYYAKGGVGLDIPLGKRVDLFGAANILYTTESDNSDVAGIESTDQLRNHAMYNVGLRIKLSKSVDTDKELDRTFNKRFDPEREKFEQQIDERDQRLAEYQDRIDDLEEELKEAFADNDEERAVEIMKQKKSLEEDMQNEGSSSDDPLIRMSPAELESLIDKVMNGVDEEEDKNSVDNRLDRLEQLLLRMNENRSGQSNAAPNAAQPASNVAAAQGQAFNPDSVSNTRAAESSANDRLVEEISKLQQRLNDQNNTISELQDNQGKASSDNNRNVEIHRDSDRKRTTDDYSSASGFNFSRGMAVFVGPSFGDATNVNIGLRSYHTFSNSSIMFAPEFYVGLGSKFAFGVNANGLIPISINSDFTPYVGAGIGLNYIDSKLKFAPNFIAGVSKKVGRSSVFLEYTARGAFKNNQLALGYRFKF